MLDTVASAAVIAGGRTIADGRTLTSCSDGPHTDRDVPDAADRHSPSTSTERRRGRVAVAAVNDPYREGTLLMLFENLLAVGMGRACLASLTWASADLKEA